VERASAVVLVSVVEQASAALFPYTCRRATCQRKKKLIQ
jgi:hypothetical protein